MAMNKNAEIGSTGSVTIPPDGDTDVSGGSGQRSNLNIVVERPAYTQTHFDEGFEATEKSKVHPIRALRDSAVNAVSCNAKCAKNFFLGLFPFIGIMRTYNLRTDLVADVIAGLTVGIMHIPQGMAYAMLASVPPVVGLYVSFFPVLIYFFIGTSRHISLGTFAVISLMVGSVVDKEVINDFNVNNPPPTTAPAPTMDPLATTVSFSYGNITAMMNGTQGPSDGMQEYNKRLVEYQIATACSVTLLVAFMQLGMGILRLGFLTIYLSDPLISGFTTGAAFHVLTSQVKHMFGLNPGRYYGAFKLIRTWIDLFTQIPQTNFGALITTVVCVIGLVLVKECINARFKDKLKMPVPIELIVVIVGTAVSHFAKFNERFDMKIVGSIPTGIPPPKAPPMNRMGEFVGDAFATAIVAFAITISMAKIFAKKHDYEVDSNQELIAGGIVNGVSSFFSCYVTAASLSRSLIQDTVGGVTQVVGLVSCVLILVVLLALGPLFESLPNCVLAAIILVALKGMFKQFTELHRLWNVCKVDFMVWLVTWACTVFLDVDLGLIIGVGFSLLTVVFRTQRPHTCILGRVAHTDLYRDVQMYNGLKEIPGVKIFRFEASLYYASREHFKDKLYEQTMCNPRKIKQQRVKIQRKIDNAIKDEKNKFKKSQKTKDGTELTEFNREDFEIRIKGEYPMPSFEIHHIIIDCSTMGYIDSVGVTALTQTINEYKEADVTIFLAHCKGNVREMLHRAGFFDRHDRGMIFPTTHDAVLHALDNYQDVKADLERDCVYLGSAISYTGSGNLYDNEEVQGANNIPEITIEDANEDTKSKKNGGLTEPLMDSGAKKL